MALVDDEADRAGAVSLGRVGHGFARATHVATAVFDPAAFDRPISSSHCFFLPVFSVVFHPYRNLAVVSV
jgi:hypothetical protein